jgi:1-acyl-sn-glycerol-3-phosphate acyltransferase
MIYRLVWWFCQLAFGLVFRRRVLGREHIPARGPVIIASNHISNLDPPVVGTGFWRHAHYMAKEELFRNPLFAWFIRQLHAFPVKRGTADRSSLKYALDVLERGEALVIFPEGTRSDTGELQPLEMGVGMIAYRSGAPVVPAWISGTNRALPKSGGLHLARFLVVYGEPLRFEVPEGVKPGREEYEAAANRIHAAIAALRDRHAGSY